MDVKIKLIFARNLCELLEEHEKTQADLARYIGVSSATVSDWSNGKKMPRADKVSIIANWLGVDLSELLTEKKKAVTIDTIAAGLNEQGRARLMEYARLLALDPTYKKDGKL